jgi:hypothetical protein
MLHHALAYVVDAHFLQDHNISDISSVEWGEAIQSWECPEEGVKRPNYRVGGSDFIVAKGGAGWFGRGFFLHFLPGGGVTGPSDR